VCEALVALGDLSLLLPSAMQLCIYKRAVLAVMVINHLCTVTQLSA
jgi:hypothetical protein